MDTLNAVKDNISSLHHTARRPSPPPPHNTKDNALMMLGSTFGCYSKNTKKIMGI